MTHPTHIRHRGQVWRVEALEVHGEVPVYALTTAERDRDGAVWYVAVHTITPEAAADSVATGGGDR